MKQLSTRQLRIEIGKLTEKDCPIIITNHGKCVFVLESASEMERLWNAAEFEPERLARENNLLAGFITRKLRISKATAIEDEEYAREENPEGAPVVPTSKSKKLAEFEQMLANWKPGTTLEGKELA